ncbi:MAG: glycosyltransferase family 4 protein [Gemmatimonadaceae bacterium]|nr:glycosyltransferase family 4 protein [Gemmatimonadaceae bacterium]
MKILLVSDYGTPAGGAEVQLLGLRKELRRRGHDARLFSSSARPEAGPRGQADYECFGTLSSFRTIVQTANPSAYHSLKRVLAEFKPDVVHVKLFLTQLSPLILPLLRSVPSIYYVAWYRPVCPLGTKMLPDGSECSVRFGAPCYSNGCLPLHDWAPLMLQMKLWRRWRGVFRLIVTNSEATRRFLTADGIDVSAVLSHGTEVRDPRPPLSPPPTVSFAGRLVREKGVDILLHAFAKIVQELPDARLLIAGDGPERDNVHRLARKLGIASSVDMTGHLSRDVLEQTCEAAWVQAVPSLWAEPFGIVAVEAMMRGRAVVATAGGGLSEIIRDGLTGYLVPPGDAQSLADALLKLLRDRAVAERMGAAARSDALLRFSESVFADQLLELYQHAINGEVRMNGAA